MPEQSQTPPPEKTSPKSFEAPEPAWPAAPAAFGRYYRCDDPNHPGHELAVMSWDSWVDFGTIFERFRRTCGVQDARIKELIAENAEKAIQNETMLARLQNLREVRRGEKRAELEGELILPGDERLKLTRR